MTFFAPGVRREDPADSILGNALLIENLLDLLPCNLEILRVLTITHPTPIHLLQRRDECPFVPTPGPTGEGQCPFADDLFKFGIVGDLLHGSLISCQVDEWCISEVPSCIQLFVDIVVRIMELKIHIGAGNRDPLVQTCIFQPFIEVFDFVCGYLKRIVGIETQ